MIYAFMTIISVPLMFAYNVLKNASTSGDSFSTEGYTYKLLLSKFIFLAAFLVICVPGMIRYDVGIDYTTYSTYQIPTVLLKQNVAVEPMYRLIINLGYWLGKGETYQYIFAITNFLIILFLFKYIENQSMAMGFSIFVFMAGGFFAFSLSGMRQSIAVVIVLYSLKFLKKRKLIKFCSCIIIGSLFHTSVLIFLPLYFCQNIKINPYWVLVIMGFIYLFSKNIRDILIIMSEKLGIYSNYFGGQFDNGSFNRLMVVLPLMVMLFVCMSFNILGKDVFYRFNTELNMHYVACLIIAMISQLPTPSRLLFLFIPVYITLIPNMIHMYRNIKIRYLVSVIVYFFLGMFMYWNIYVQNIYDILPYQDVFKWFG